MKLNAFLIKSPADLQEIVKMTVNLIAESMEPRNVPKLGRLI